MDARHWNERFDGPEYRYGTAPNAFVAGQATTLPPESSVVEVGAGEGRNAVYMAGRGFAVTAVDYAEAGLEKARRLAAEKGVTIETVCADLLAWRPERTWNAVVATFVHLPPAQRPALYRQMQDLLAPGGWLVAEWFHPDQVAGGYTSGGPPSADLMVTPEELAEHFEARGLFLCERRIVPLDEGEGHRGEGVVTRLRWQKPR